MRGYLCIGTHGGYEIEVLTDTILRYKLFDGEWVEAIIKHDKEGAYFIHDGYEDDRLYLSEFMRL